MTEKVKMKHSKEASVNFIVRGDSFDEAWATYFNSKESPHWLKYFNEKNQRLENADVSYRVLNHWEKMGLLGSDRPEGKGWRKYSTMDLIWVHLLFKLRSFGISIEVLKKIRDEIHKSPGAPAISEYPKLEFYLATVMMQQQLIYFLVFENGDYEIASHSEYEFSLTYSAISGDHFKVNLSRFIAEIFNNPYTPSKFNSKFHLSAHEVEVLLMLRSGVYESVEIKLRNGQLEFIEAVREFETETRLVDILKSAEFQELRFIQKDGKITTIKQTETRKLKSEK